MAVKNTEVDNINVDVNCLYFLEAPVEANKKIGTLKVKIGNETIQTVDIVIETEIKRKEITDYFYQFLDVIY